MRNNCKKWMIVAGLSLSVAARAQDAAPAGSTPVGSTPDAGKIKLEFRPREGQVRVMRLNVVQDATQVVRGKRKTNMRQTIGYDIAYRVLPAASDGRNRLHATVRAVRLGRVIDGKTQIAYNSANPPKKLSGDAELFALLPGLSFVMQMNDDGTIGQIENKDDITNQMMDKMKISKSDRTALRPLMRKALDGNAFKNIGNTFASFPNREISVGDSWIKRDIVADQWNLIYDGNLSLARREAGGLSRFHVKSNIKPDPKRGSGKAFPITGTQTGYYLVEEASGWTKSAQLKQRWTGYLGANNQFVAATAKNARPLYMKMDYDVSTLGVK